LFISPKQAGDSGSSKGEDEEHDHRPADLIAADQLGAVVENGEADCGGEERREPRDVFLPFHAELVPLGRLLLGE
jgi:hypothetical protein